MTIDISDIVVFIMSLVIFYYNYKVNKLEKMCNDTFNAMIEVQNLAENHVKQINKSINQINAFINRLNQIK